MYNPKIPFNIQNKYPQKPSIYDQQLNFLKYMERKNMNLEGVQKIIL